ncbi:MAG: hypothetical protein PHQ23_02210 [Candidatus Wallbacteria bacterium]|nr:hypothetical protein [Candidatus Wallbacteria bacterium]
MHIHNDLQNEPGLSGLFDSVVYFSDEKQLTPVVPRALVRRGPFLAPYDYGPGITDRRQWVLRLSQACPAHCAYCYIKAVFPDAPPRFFYSLSDLDQELAVIKAQEKHPYINAGENADSFAFDEQAKQSLILYELARKHPDCTFELRTKLPSRVCRDFFLQPALMNLIIAVSLNPAEISSAYEIGADSLEERLSALEGFYQHGYRISLRLDPLIYSRDFEKHYGSLFFRLDEFGIRKFSDIQIGGLRFARNQYAALAREKLPPDFLSGEFVKGLDGKWRYFIDVRLKMYAFLLERLKRCGVPVSLSNETAKCHRRLGL